MRIYTDGSCKQEYGGWAWFIEPRHAKTRNGKPYARSKKRSNSGYEYPSTNQRMELTAALEALMSNWEQATEITIVSDSAYLVNCFNDGWWITWRSRKWRKGDGTSIANLDLWQPLIDLVILHGDVTFEKVKGHSGDPGNDMVDKMAGEAADYLRKRKGVRV